MINQEIEIELMKTSLRNKTTNELRRMLMDYESRENLEPIDNVFLELIKKEIEFREDNNE